ncbi:MAG: YiiG family protein [Bacteroidia bacterium]|nr:YiiG family protein [Bacteroidia bacterium]
MRNLVYLLALLVSDAMAQTISSAQQKALNNYIDYANQSAQEVEAVVNGIRQYYPHVLRAAEGKRDYYTRYACTTQQEAYYLKTSHDESKALGSYASGIESRLNALKAAADAIDKLCKALDTYHKLEDYKQDNYNGAMDYIKSLPALLASYVEAQRNLDKELHGAFRKLQPYVATNAYHAADAMMRESLDKERAFIDLWKVNLHNEVHTGWVVPALEAAILDTDVRVKAFASKSPAVKYPASSMLSSFAEGLSSILEAKRNGLNGYNTDAKKSDQHSNQVYDYLVNYYNGVLVSFYNNYFTYTGSDGYHGLKAMQYVPMVEIRSAQVSAPVVVRPFDDTPRRPVVLTPQR